MFTTLSVKKIIKVLEDVGFKPGYVLALARFPSMAPVSTCSCLHSCLLSPNSAQKTLHGMLGNDPRYLRPGNREEMHERIDGLSASGSRRGSNARASPQAQGTAADAPRSRASSGVPRGAAPDMEMLDESVSVGGGKRSWPESKATFTFEPSSPFSPSQTSSQLSPLHIDTTLSAEGSVAYGSPPAGLAESQSSFQSTGFGFAPKPLKHTTTMFSASTTASTPSLRSLKARMSINSTTFAKQVSSLIRQFTIGSESNLGNFLNTTGADSQRSGAAGHDRTGKKPLPGEFFNAYNACEHEPAKWQEVVDMLSEIPDFWVTPEGDLSGTATLYLNHPAQENFSARDCFGNTPLHLAAWFARCDYMLHLIQLCTAEQLCSSNTAGQTFLHVLSHEWFQNLDDQSAPLLQLLFYVRRFCPEIVAQCDVYGRTFFHHMQDIIPDQTLMSIVLGTCDASLLPRRDAFDTRPVIAHGTSFTLTGGPRHTQALSPLPEEVVGSPVSASSPIQEMDMFTQHHAGLLRTVTAADANPAVEDACGRNALHCLAEVILGNEDTLQERHSTLKVRRPPKRKFDQRGGGKNDGDGADCGPNNTTAEERPLARRLEFLRGLLALPGMDANHYDRDGNTALMAFIQHLRDQDEDKHRTLSTMFRLLITEGGARVEARNSRGETALLLAARLGRKTAVQVLLQQGGANVHARDVEGKGALDLIDEACLRSKGDTQLYGRLQACRVLLTGRYKDEWAAGGDHTLQSPTVMDEWRARPPRPGFVVFQ